MMGENCWKGGKGKESLNALTTVKVKCLIKYDCSSEELYLEPNFFITATTGTSI